MNQEIEKKWKQIETIQAQLKMQDHVSEQKLQEIMELQAETKEMMDKIIESNKQFEFQLRQKMLSWFFILQKLPINRLN